MGSAARGLGPPPSPAACRRRRPPLLRVTSSPPPHASHPHNPGSSIASNMQENKGERIRGSTQTLWQRGSPQHRRPDLALGGSRVQCAAPLRFLMWSGCLSTLTGTSPRLRGIRVARVHVELPNIRYFVGTKGSRAFPTVPIYRNLFPRFLYIGTAFLSYIAKKSLDFAFPTRSFC